MHVGLIVSTSIVGWNLPDSSVDSCGFCYPFSVGTFQLALNLNPLCVGTFQQAQQIHVFIFLLLFHDFSPSHLFSWNIPSSTAADKRWVGPGWYYFWGHLLSVWCAWPQHHRPRHGVRQEVDWCRCSKWRGRPSWTILLVETRAAPYANFVTSAWPLGSLAPPPGCSPQRFHTRVLASGACKW